MPTPESRVKKLVSNLLRGYRPALYYDMPVPGGYGKSTLDYIGCYYGRFFAIETKKPGGRPTDRQNIIITQMQASGGMVFVVDSEETLQDVRRWIESIKAANDVSGFSQAPSNRRPP